MLFATGAVAGGLIVAADDHALDEVWPFGRRVAFTLLSIYAMRMAAVFTISTTTLATRLGLVPRWLSAVGFATGLLLLFSIGLLPWVELVFPTWVLVFSVYILIASPRTGVGSAGAEPATV